MKRIIALTIICIAALLGCGKKNEPSPAPVTETSVSAELNSVAITSVVEEDSSIAEEVEYSVTVDDNGIPQFDYDSLGVTEYDYPEEFVLEDNTKALIELVAKTGDYKTHYGDYGPLSNYPDWYHSSIIRDFIRLDGDVYDYKRINRSMTREQIEYIYYSITGRYLPFENVTEPIACSTSGTPMRVFVITDYEYELDGEDVLITANATCYHRNDRYDDYFIVYARLTPNKYSCFDGYSIADVYTEEIPQWITHDNKEHKFVLYGQPDMRVYEGAINSDIYGEDLDYGMFVTVNLTDEQIKYVEKHIGEDFEVNWDFTEDKTLPIYSVDAKTIKVVEQ